LIDDVTPDNPAFVYNADAKSAFANGRALEIASIDKDTKDPFGGVIFRDSAGEPTGVLRGSAIALGREQGAAEPHEKLARGP
jgi:predicted amidohydrolase YtcJ